jgi:CYTH domain-containing protein
MAIISKINHTEWANWLKTRPASVRRLCERLPPDRLYRMKSTGQRVTLIAYSENDTVRVNITGRYNLVSFDRQVFGVSADDLEECDLPPSDELIGTLLTQQEDIDALIESLRPPCEVHEYQWEPRMFGGEVQRCKVCGFHLDSSWRPRV